ncbi:transglycosylase domain-containing protein [Sphingosinicella terrae]|uniref:transglycosylase domain-containing protein n=1 Tax=Sphingosinicella terrae TaxID=2172047 RepID=UPI000E0DCFCD|nr:PBP1A family penicillin-binding protein [Sphingosinicella terrae]
MASAPPSRLKRVFVASFKIGAYLLVVGLVALGVAVSVAVSQLPSYPELIRRDDLGQMIRVRAADGSIIHSMGPSFGEWLRHDEIPPIMRDAMVAVEDRRFRSHPGVDPIGIVRALMVRAQEGRWRQGGSTITQQLARNIFLTNDRSFARKVREAILALALEWRFTKEQILELYLNRVYFGGGAYGIDAASRTFFDHSATELSTAEAAIIAGLVKAPSNYSPTADMEAARGRAGVVLGLMVENSTISAAEAAAADPEDVTFVRPRGSQNITRYFTDWVLPQLDMLIDETVQPLDVWTTIDIGMQRAAAQTINANAPGGAQGALVSLDRDGAVRAMVGGRDYATSIYNRATQATRQPGSSFKLFVYLAALESGYRSDSTVQDAPITIGNWSPRNDNGRYAGPVALRTAFTFSINTVAVRLAQDVGTRAVADMAQRFGITTRIATNPSMALGSSEVRLIDMTRAYAAVARGGVAVTPYGIRRVTTADGTLLYQHEAEEGRVLVQPWVAAQMTDLLQSVVDHGTGRAAQLGRPTAGKTGTTTSNKDGWFVGFSSGITTGVWMGRDDNRALPGLAGGRAPARAFHDYMVRAVAGRPAEPFVTEAAAPDWHIEQTEEFWFAPPQDDPMLDADGSPIEETPPPFDRKVDPDGMPIEEEEQDDGAPPRLDREWLDRALERPRPPERGPPPVRRTPEEGYREGIY